MIGLTITTCKRIDLFEKTIISFVEKCEDCGLIDIIIHYDDSSSLEDRDKMFSLLNRLFPKTLIVSKRFNINSFKTKNILFVLDGTYLLLATHRTLWFNFNMY